MREWNFRGLFVDVSFEVCSVGVGSVVALDGDELDCVGEGWKVSEVV